MKYTVHPSSDVQSSNIGDGTTIWQFCVVLKGAQIGSNCNINAQVFIENDVKIGDEVTVKSGVQLWDGIQLHDHTFVGPNVTFTNDFVPRSKHYPEQFLKTVVREGASIGANATIIGGVTIGRYALVGAGSVLTRSIGDHELWVGNPARHVGYVSMEGDLLNMELTNKKGDIYQWVGDQLLRS